MKSSTHIISSIKNDATFANMRLLDELHLFQSMFFTPELQKYILYIHFETKKSTLLIATNHPSYIVEIDYMSKQIIDILKATKEKFPTLSNTEKVVAYIPIKRLMKKAQGQKRFARFKELSRGGFENLATDSNLKEVFEKIRAHINNINKIEKD